MIPKIPREAYKLATVKLLSPTVVTCKIFQGHFEKKMSYHASAIQAKVVYGGKLLLAQASGFPLVVIDCASQSNMRQPGR